ncbi:hypothetical protein [Clostridium fallax]|uniref:Uncharacterized protein n=1 Tax=Clostridium fallax TaxID=1533 RepID=A0A1M4SGV3_9CLOT|nr:hypothetical protein [Clostridium fallax]SHE31227.1 hypothetical protein SAMN05443638_10115 [Clostridium fallax]SQB07817.1 Uncharacterised protein [Clostridium fallax]
MSNIKPTKNLLKKIGIDNKSKMEEKIEKLEEKTVKSKFQKMIKEKNKTWKEKLLEKLKLLKDSL